MLKKKYSLLFYYIDIPVNILFYKLNAKANIYFKNNFFNPVCKVAF